MPPCKFLETNRTHNFQSLNLMKQEITAHFKNLLKSASDKITEICKLDKQVWKMLDKEEIQCKVKIKKIEQARDDQVKSMYRLLHIYRILVFKCQLFQN